MKKLIFVVAVMYGDVLVRQQPFQLRGHLGLREEASPDELGSGGGLLRRPRLLPAQRIPEGPGGLHSALTDYSTGAYTAKGLFHLASGAAENRDYEVARKSLQRFIEEFPDHKDKRDAEQRLEYIKYK